MSNAHALQPSPHPLHRWLTLLAGLAALGGVIAAAWALAAWLEGAGAAAALRERGGLTAAMGLTLVHAAVAVSPVPGETVAVTNAAIYGFWWGMLMAWIGWMIAAVVEYGLTRGAIRSLALERTVSRLPARLRRLPADHPLFLIGGRWVPFGGHVVNIAAGAAAPFGRHLWCAAISIVPVAALFSALANGWRLFW